MSAYIVDAVRTPRGRGKRDKGALSNVHPQELLAQALRALAARGTFDPKDVNDTIIGCVSQAGEQGANIARNAVLAAGWPDEVSAVSMNRFCGSGLQAISFAAMGVMSGAQDVVIAGGVESMSRVPMGSDGGGVDGHNEQLRETVFQVPQGISADLVATLYGFSREEIDRFALESQKRAARAQAEGRFDKSIVPVVDRASGTTLLAHDEMVRKDATMEALARLEPSFRGMGEALDPIALRRYTGRVTKIQHVHTAGNSSGIVDGAAAVVVASDAYVKAHGVRPRARIVSMATIGSEPVIMLTGPAPASRRALERAKLNPKDIDIWEINEAFGAVVLQTARELDLDFAKINPNGGAIALGHPLGATGAMLVSTAVDELERSSKSTAAITMCIGGGQGIAMVIERV